MTDFFGNNRILIMFLFFLIIVSAAWSNDSSVTHKVSISIKPVKLWNCEYGEIETYTAMGLNVIEMSVSYAVTWIDRGDITKSIMIRYPDNLPEKNKAGLLRRPQQGSQYRLDKA
jgi:hypothetical protein